MMKRALDLITMPSLYNVFQHPDSSNAKNKKMAFNAKSASFPYRMDQWIRDSFDANLFPLQGRYKEVFSFQMIQRQIRVSI
ncbi:hypothetical protein RchiOBHm_Chr5g0007371 [Rosa chinensis]|uniref:Uncharacterized protein n=1 Tax=Rosa chinensis TaxID=74649 RepID=A0A2P6Q3T6_ROSCH|nr:hypothetical protein RchiOBHm_Chr5g0007371 [Rosa chinensis]